MARDEAVAELRAMPHLGTPMSAPWVAPKPGRPGMMSQRVECGSRPSLSTCSGKTHRLPASRTASSVASPATRWWAWSKAVGRLDRVAGAEDGVGLEAADLPAQAARCSATRRRGLHRRVGHAGLTAGERQVAGEGGVGPSESQRQQCAQNSVPRPRPRRACGRGGSLPFSGVRRGSPDCLTRAGDVSSITERDRRDPSVVAHHESA